MKRQIRKMTLSRALVASLLDGLITALAIIVFTYIYREITGYEQIDAINPLLVFIGAPILLLLAGGVYFLLVHNLFRGELLFITLFTALTLVGVGSVVNLQSGTNEGLLSTSHGLLFGTILIAGFACVILLPYLTHHPGIYFTQREEKWEEEEEEKA